MGNEIAGWKSQIEQISGIRSVRPERAFCNAKDLRAWCMFLFSLTVFRWEEYFVYYFRIIFYVPWQIIITYGNLCFRVLKYIVLMSEIKWSHGMSSELRSLPIRAINQV